MLDLISLIQFILQDKIQSHDEAASIVVDAGRLEADLLLHIAHRFAISGTDIYAHSAQFCGLPFSPVVPDGLIRDIDGSHIDRLGDMRSVTIRVQDRDILFLAPGAAQMLALAHRRQSGLSLMRDICVVPPAALRAALIRAHADNLLQFSRQRLARRWPFASAHLDLTLAARLGFVTLLSALVGVTALVPFALSAILLPLLALLFLPPSFFRLAALMEKPKRPRPADDSLLPDVALPVYSVLIPLRDETGMVPQLAAAMRALDYPPEKLDIKFVVEASSAETVAAVKPFLDDPRFELIVVPPCAPHTKPKALNYTLPMVRGDHLVVYDAEDIPEPDQLRRAASQFDEDPCVDCLQAELRIDNAGESWLTALFAAEYSGLFGIMLPALAHWRLPVPLGGTSNHFRTASLREVGGWDAFNVTEDADLGIRFARLRYRVGTLKSRTYEEAPVRMMPWIRQRTRWMKGWMQTFIVHNRYPLQFLRDAGWRNFLVFQIYIGGMIFSAPLHLVFVIALLIRGSVALFAGTPVQPMAFAHMFVLAAGYFGACVLAIAGTARLPGQNIGRYQWLLPLYWGLTGIAAFRAMYELVVRPYFWAKTGHGVTEHRRGPVSGQRQQTRPETTPPIDLKKWGDAKEPF